jgi:hypothetical protein
MRVLAIQYKKDICYSWLSVDDKRTLSMRELYSPGFKLPEPEITHKEKHK